jgi:hypothetical protein
MGSPVDLVFVGAVAQGLMLPFLGLAAVYFRFRRTEAPLRPGPLWTIFLVLSALAMMLVGAYQVGNETKKRFFPKPAAVRVTHAPAA